MTVPAWAAREWRPATRDLCARMLDRQSDSESIEDRDVNHDQRQLLRADKVIAKLYSHRYMDVTPQQITSEIDALATKMELHLLPERAGKLRSLAASCDYRVVKLLIELAESPTRASDAAVSIDLNQAPLDALKAWNRLLTPSKAVMMAESKASDDAALVSRMETELLEVAWQDDWWQERMDDDDVSELHDAMDSGMDSDISSDAAADDDDGEALGIIGGKFLASKPTHLEGEKEDDDMDSDLHSTDAADEDHDDEEQEEDVYDYLLLQYYPLSSSNDEAKPATESMAVEGRREQSTLVPRFSFDRPSTLLPLVQRLHRQRSSTETSDRLASAVEPRRVVHERVVVDAIFFALHGIPSALFEFETEPGHELLGAAFTPTKITVSSLLRRGLAVSHLSPMALYSVVQQIASNATRLHFLRDVSHVLGRTLCEEQRSTVAEGLANEIQRLLHGWKIQIDATQRGMQASTHAAADDPFEKVKYPTLPTLLGTAGSLKELFATVTAVQQALVYCLASVTPQSVSPALVSSTILSSLHQQITVAYVASSSTAGKTTNRILSQLFAAAMAPYLDAIDTMLFTPCYADRIPLRRELFFAPVSTDNASPRHSMQKHTALETFDDVMAAMIPFTIDRATVPVFLEPLVPAMSAALESRQILNRFHNHGKSISDTSNSSLRRMKNQSSAPLADLFHKEFEMENDGVPFASVVHNSVARHIEAKCVLTTGRITDLFRRNLHFREHMTILRLFLLMHQQDVFTYLAQVLIERMRSDPVGWARSEPINAAFQEAIQTLHEEGQLSADQREIAARISIRVDPRRLERVLISRHIDIEALHCLQFKFSTTAPLRVLFSGSVIDKYSTLGTLLLQVKLAELMLTNFKQSFRHRQCAQHLETPIRHAFVRLADMLQFSRAVLHYLASQMTGEAWSRVERVFEASHSIREMNTVHCEYLDRMLHHFFLLKKHEGFTKQFMRTFNDMIAYVSTVDDFVRTVERNVHQLFTASTPLNAAGTDGREGRSGQRQRVPTPEFHTLVTNLAKSLKGPETNYENQMQVITIVLDAMTKNGASPHVNELSLLLTFNGYRAPSRTRR